MIKFFLLAMCLLSWASLSFAVERDGTADSSGACAEVIKYAKETKAKEKKNLIEPEYYVAPVSANTVSSTESSSDAQPDRITHREVTSANVRRGDGSSRADSFSDKTTSPNDGSLRNKVIDSARGPNSMAENIKNNQHLNRSQYNKSGGVASSGYGHPYSPPPF